MTIQSHLDELRRNVVGCRLAAFGDLSSGLILRASSDTNCSQNVLDAHCEKAIRYFSLLDQDSSLVSADHSIYGTSFVSFTDQSATVYARDGRMSSDVICVVVEEANSLASSFDLTSIALKSISEHAP